MELHWKNKDRSLFINYEKDFDVQWIPKQSKIITESRDLILLDQSCKVKDLNSLHNSLILGDNLFVLNTIIENIKDSEDNKKVKFVYIDPPYNTFNPGLSYKDSLQHDQWLTFMLDRLERVKKIIAPDGIVCIQIDDKEYARLYLIMIELFGEKNLKTIVVKMSESSGVKMQNAKIGGIPKLKEYLILAKMDGIQGFHFKPTRKEKWDTEYNLFIKNFTLKDKELLKHYQGKKALSLDDIQKIDLICKKFELVTINKIFEEEHISEDSKLLFLTENAWRICRTASSSSIFSLTEEKKSTLAKPQQIFSVISKRGLLYFVKSDYTPEAKKPRVQILFADEHLTMPLGDLWTDIKTTGLEFEGEIDFKNGKKPEKLLKRLIEGTTNQGDLVMDLFSGSGTTLSVALELKRTFIGIEVNFEIFQLAKGRIEKKRNQLSHEIEDNIQIKYLKVANSKIKIS